jgi:hypothetical protein
MAPFRFPFSFTEAYGVEVKGDVELEQPIPFSNAQGGGLYRTGKVHLAECPALDVVLYHSRATAHFMYVRECPVDAHLLDLIGLPREETVRLAGRMRLPGQLCLGAERTALIGRAVQDLVGAPPLSPAIARCSQKNIAVFPIAREGLKYQVAEALQSSHGYYCDEIVLDAHHVFDSSVPVYNRKVELTVFKDKDLNKGQKERISLAFIADSISSGLVMREVIERVEERFDHLAQIEVISPLATIRGLTRIARSKCMQDAHIRLHVFETLLNALPPDFYYSAHFDVPELHIRPDLQSEYRQWWGQDAQGNHLADTACAGYGWSEVFYSPRKQIQMINDQLLSRHALGIADVVRRNVS